MTEGPTLVIHTPRRAVRRRVAVVLTAAATLAATAACSSSQAGAAAVVGDRRISVSDVQEATSQIVAAYGPDSGVTQAAVLGQLVLAPYVLSAGSDIGGGVSDADAQAQLKAVKAQSAAQSGAIASEAPEPVPGAATLLAMRSVITLNAVQGGQLPAEQVQQFFAAVQAQVRAAGVEVSPRYGTFDIESLGVNAATPDWVKSEPTATAPAPGDTAAPQTTPGTETP